ncbi:HNH endonuclease [Actinomadura graeca]|uniref:HNH endonuclease n=1 Tax=Actinomadura graeca TaxID=2750812 RepID=A0ABX8QZ11_9ACTN|nr:HNH endonuclease domain-containing protein [Actinomadura graeca]QXJ24066.1 HNH endonuclease [Actinomadura graeca]
MSEEFYKVDPTPRSSWRLAVLMGANSRTYKFALGDALLQVAASGRTEVLLDELTVPYAMSLLRHMEQAPQAAQSSATAKTDFLKIAEREAAESRRLGRPTEALVRAAAKNMPGMVMQKFHNLGKGSQVPHRFYELEGSARERIVRFSPELRQVALSEQTGLLQGELEARWNIVESSFATDINRTLLQEGVAVDLQAMKVLDKRRRRAITGVKEAVIGFQHGLCLICGHVLGPNDEYAIDHVFPWSLMDRMGWQGPDLDSVWNLAPAHVPCNLAKSNRLPYEVELSRLAQRNEAIMHSPHPLRKTLQLTLQNGTNRRIVPGGWPYFIRSVLALITT